MVLPFNPKDTLLLLEKVTAERLLEVAPAETLIAEIKPAMLGTVYEAVSTEELESPNEIPFELVNERVPEVPNCVPAEKPPMFPVAVAPAPTLAVIVLAFNPNVTPEPLLNEKFERLVFVVPALMLICALAVI